MNCKDILMQLVRSIRRLLVTSPDQTAELAAAKADARLAHEQLAALQTEVSEDALTDAERAEVTETLNLVAAAQPPDSSGASGASGASGPAETGATGPTGSEGSGLPAQGEGTGAALNGAFVTGAGVQGIGDREGEAITSLDPQTKQTQDAQSGATGA